MTTIGDLHGLDQNDPWQRSCTPTEQGREAISRRWFDIAKQLPNDEPSFVDSPHDESMTIGERPQCFWRITVTNHCLGDLVEMLPSLRSISYTMRNNKAGCWVAMTSRRVAQRSVQLLCEFGVQARIDTCNEAGNALQACKQQPGTIMYCIGVYRDGVRGCFVPRDFWERHHCMSDDIALADRLKRDFHPTELPYCFRTDLPLPEAKQLLDNMGGFQESLLVQALVNELLQ